MRAPPLTDTQRIVTVYVVGFLGLAVLVGSPAVSSAERPPIPVVTYCGCTCWYSGAGGKTQNKGVTFTTSQTCSVYNGQTCYCTGETCYSKYNEEARYKGVLQACQKVPPVIQREPSAPVPPRRVKPPPLQPPAAK